MRGMVERLPVLRLVREKMCPAPRRIRTRLITWRAVVVALITLPLRTYWLSFDAGHPEIAAFFVFGQAKQTENDVADDDPPSEA